MKEKNGRDRDRRDQNKSFSSTPAASIAISCPTVITQILSFYKNVATVQTLIRPVVKEQVVFVLHCLSSRSVRKLRVFMVDIIYHQAQ